MTSGELAVAVSGPVSVPEDKRAAAAQGMLHAWWAERVPDRLAVVSPHGDRSYDGPQRRHQPPGAGAAGAGAPGRRRRRPDVHQPVPSSSRSLYASQRIGLRFTPDQLAPDRPRGRLHRRELRGQGVRLRRRAGRARSPAPPPAGGPGLVKINTGGYLPGFEMYNSVARRRGRRATSRTRCRAPRCSTPRAPPGGPRACTAPPPPVSALATVNFCGYDEDWATQPRRPPPHRAAVPRGPARLLGGGALPLRRAPRRHGPLGRRWRRSG